MQVGGIGEVGERHGQGRQEGGVRSEGGKGKVSGRHGGNRRKKRVK